MALLSKVIRIEVPSAQPETPQPMTGQPLEVFTVGPFLDPAGNGTEGFVLMLQYENPRLGLSTPPTSFAALENEDGEPQHIFGIHDKVVDWEWLQTVPYFVQSQPFNAFQPADASRAPVVGVFKGTIRPENISPASASEVSAISSFALTLNNDADKTEYLLTRTPPSQNFSSNAYDLLDNTLAFRSAAGDVERPIHAWVMCGRGYVITSSGRVLVSENAFSSVPAELEKPIGMNNVMTAPGIIENETIGL